MCQIREEESPGVLIHPDSQFDAVLGCGEWVEGKGEQEKTGKGGQEKIGKVAMKWDVENGKKRKGGDMRIM